MFCCDHWQSLWSQNFVCFTVSYCFWGFKFFFFLKWPPFSWIWPDFCQKLISVSFKYTGCSYKILSRFIQLFDLHRGNEIFFKLLNLKPWHWGKLRLIIANNIWNRPALLTICRIFILLAVSEIVGVCFRRHFLPKPYTLPVGNA